MRFAVSDWLRRQDNYQLTMARQYLAEGIRGAVTFDVDRSKPFVTESEATETGARINRTRIPGRLSVCDCVNGNKRRYSKQVWEKNLASGSTLQKLIAENAAFGLLEHPKDGVVGLNHPDISHQVTGVQMVEAKNPDGTPRWEVHGEISVYEDLEPGRKLMALIRGGYNPLVSSRGFGSLVTDSAGVDDVQDDYVCEGWDCVRTPSFEQAQLTPVREPIAPSTTARMATPVTTTTESLVAPAASTTTNVVVNPVPAAESTSPAKVTTESSPSPQPSVPKTIMELTEIKSRLNALRGVDPAKLDPRRFAESLSEVEQLHTAVAEYTAVDPKRAYEGSRLHRELETVTEAYSKAANAPRQQATKLVEDNRKLLQVVQATANTAVVYKKKLGEAIGATAKAKETVTEAVRRGKGWHKLAEDRKAKLVVTEERFSTACEALDIMSARYHADTTELARRLLQVEFKDQLAAKPALVTKLNEATRLKHVVAIREEIEGKQPEEGSTPDTSAIKKNKVKGNPGPAAGKVASEPGKVANEGKPAPVARPITEAKVSFSTDRDPRSLDESVAMLKRLSVPAAK